MRAKVRLVTSKWDTRGCFGDFITVIYDESNCKKPMVSSGYWPAQPKDPQD